MPASLRLMSKWTAVAGLLVLCGQGMTGVAAKEIAKSHGLDVRPVAQAYLRMPTSTNDAPPPLLSQTGAFKDTRHLIPADSLIPYDLNVSFWSDGANKSRWISVPNDAASGHP